MSSVTGRAQERSSAEPPTVALVPMLEANFRGDRGSAPGGDRVQFSNGLTFGLRAHAWLSETLGVSAHGGFARAGYCFEGASSFCTTGNEVTLWRALGELTARVKPRVPGYFVVGGGVMVVAPDEDALFSDGSSLLEPTVSAAAGIDFRVSRRGFARLELRTYLIFPEEQPGLADTDSSQLDFALGLGFGYTL